MPQIGPRRRTGSGPVPKRVKPVQLTDEVRDGVLLLVASSAPLVIREPVTSYNFGRQNVLANFSALILHGYSYRPIVVVLCKILFTDLFLTLH